MPKFLKGLLFGTIIGAMVSAYLSAKKKVDAEELVRIAEKLRENIMTKAAKLTSVTQKSYESLVEKVVDEFKDWRDLSADELEDLKKTLKDGWHDIAKLVKEKPKKRKT